MIWFAMRMFGPYLDMASKLYATLRLSKRSRITKITWQASDGKVTVHGVDSLGVNGWSRWRRDLTEVESARLLKDLIAPD